MTELDAVTGAVVRVLTGPGYGFSGPRSVAADGTHVWVTNYVGGSVTELDAVTGALVRMLTGPGYGSAAPPSSLRPVSASG